MCVCVCVRPGLETKVCYISVCLQASVSTTDSVVYPLRVFRVMRCWQIVPYFFQLKAVKTRKSKKNNKKNTLS